LHGLDRGRDRLVFAEDVERVALSLLRLRKQSRAIETNVEFCTAPPLEAVGRVAGWIAHAREQATTGQLIRPRSIYLPRQAKAA
jgi:citrate synthase